MNRPLISQPEIWWRCLIWIWSYLRTFLPNPALLPVTLVPRFESLGPHTLSTFFPDSFDTHSRFWTISVHSHSVLLHLRNRFGDLFNSIHSKKTPSIFAFILASVREQIHQNYRRGGGSDPLGFWEKWCWDTLVFGKPGLQWKIVWLVKTFQWPNLFCNYLKKSYSNNEMMRSHGHSFHGISKSCQIRFFSLSWPYPPEMCQF